MIYETISPSSEWDRKRIIRILGRKNVGKTDITGINKRVNEINKNKK